MAFFEWQPEYNTGHETIDFQHLSLVAYINRLHDAENSPPEYSQFVVRVVVENLLEYTAYHFETEEGLMKKSDYPDLANHLKEHEALRATVAGILPKLDAGEMTASQIISFIKSWILNHIVKSDKKLGAYLNEKGIVR